MDNASIDSPTGDFKFIIPLGSGALPAEDDLSSTVTMTGDEILWNVVIGCTGSSDICKQCAATAYTKRWQVRTGYYNNEESVRNVTSYMYAITDEPMRWPRDQPKRILVAPASDLFHDLVTDAFIDRVLSVMQRHPKHTFFILTKNAARMSRYFTSRAKNQFDPQTRRDQNLRNITWPLPNVWVGISCDTQRSYMSRVTHLVQTPAAKRFIVIEPMLEPIRMEQVPMETRDILWPLKGIVQAYVGEDKSGRLSWDPIDQPLAVINPINWVVLSGYRGPEVKPMHPLWALDIQRVCARSRVPFFFKGWGDYVPMRSADRDADESLVIMSKDGNLRGRGVGSATNYLSVDPASADFFMTRKAPRELHDKLGTLQFKQRPELAGPQRVRLTDLSETARQLQRMSDTQTAIEALQNVEPPESQGPEELAGAEVVIEAPNFMERAVKTAFKLSALVQGKAASTKDSAKA